MLETPKLRKKSLFRTSLPKWVRVDQNEYEFTKMSTGLPKWVWVYQNEYELTRQWVPIEHLSANWPKSWVWIDQNENELTCVRIDLSTSWREPWKLSTCTETLFFSTSTSIVCMALWQSELLTSTRKCHLSQGVTVTLGPIIWAASQENLFMPYVNTKGTDHSVQSDQHLCY